MIDWGCRVFEHPALDLIAGGSDVTSLELNLSEKFCPYCGPLCLVGYGFCHCGCNNKTKLCPINDAHRKAIAGEPQKFLLGHTLRDNSAKSIAKQAAMRTRHGHERGGVQSATYKAWASMKMRCLNQNTRNYERYGGRGIKVCERWMKSDNFLLDMGECPPRLTIERIDNNGNYEPDNCKWATRIEQQNNTSRTRILEYEGMKVTIHRLMELFNIRRKLLESRLNRGWSVERAIKTPLNEKMRNRRAKPYWLSSCEEYPSPLSSHTEI